MKYKANVKIFSEDNITLLLRKWRKVLIEDLRNDVFNNIKSKH